MSRQMLLDERASEEMAVDSGNIAKAGAPAASVRVAV
jgi:hypothetical protein